MTTTIQTTIQTTMQTTMHTPWGWTQDIEELAEGVWRVTTPSHGGLKLSRERWASLPGCVRDAMLTPTFAEEDCEEVIVRTLLGLGGDRERELALKVVNDGLEMSHFYGLKLNHLVFAQRFGQCA